MWRLVSYTHFWVLITRFQMSIIGSNAKCGQKQTKAACENCYVDVLYGWPLAVAATDANYSLQRKNNKNEEVIMESSSKCLLVIEVHLTNKQIRKFFFSTTHCYRALGSRTEIHNEDAGLCEDSVAGSTASATCVQLDWFRALCVALDSAVQSSTQYNHNMLLILILLSCL